MASKLIHDGSGNVWTCRWSSWGRNFLDVFVSWLSCVLVFSSVVGGSCVGSYRFMIHAGCGLARLAVYSVGLTGCGLRCWFSGHDSGQIPYPLPWLCFCWPKPSRAMMLQNGGHLKIMRRWSSSFPRRLWGKGIRCFLLFWLLYSTQTHTHVCVCIINVRFGRTGHVLTMFFMQWVGICCL